MEQWRARLHRLKRIKKGWEKLIIHFNQVDRPLGDLIAFGCDSCYAVANEADAMIKAKIVVRARFRIGLARGRIGDARDILMRNDRMHAGHSPSLANIDALDERMRMRAQQEFTHEHAAHFNIIGVGRIALNQLESINFWL